MAVSASDVLTFLGTPEAGQDVAQVNAAITTAQATCSSALFSATS